MAINQLQLPPIINLPTPDFSVLGSIGQDLNARGYRQQVPGLIAGMFPQQQAAPQQTAQAPTIPDPQQSAGVPLNALGQATPDASGRAQDKMYLIASAAKKYGIDPNYLLSMDSVEGTGQNPKSSASGFGQAIDSTARQYGIQRGDFPSEVDGIARFTADNKAALTQALGRPPTDGELYLAHQQGAAGALRLLSNPNAPAIAVLGPEAVVNNGGNANMTAGQFAQMWTSRFGGNAALPPNAQPAQPAPQGQGAQPAISPQAQQALAGLSPDVVQKIGAMLTNPYTAKLGEELLARYAAPKYGFQVAGDHLYRTNQATGEAQPIQQISKPVPMVIGKDQYGNDVHGFGNPMTHQAWDIAGRPIDPSNIPSTFGGAQAPTSDLHGEDFLKTLQPGQAATVKGIVEGRIPFPTGFVMKTPYGQWLVNAIGQYEPGVDANVIAQRKKLQTDLSASSPNSMGGILSNGKSAFEHLAELSDKAAALGSANGYDGPGGGMAAHAENYLGSVLGTSETKAKIGAFNQNALKYGQEATKFYAGTGGGEAERMNALKSLNPETSSGQEQAAFLENEKGLMLDRLRQKEQQVRSIMGDAYLAAHPIVTPDLQKTIAKIDANIAKLRGQETQADTAAQKQQSSPKLGSVQIPIAAAKALQSNPTLRAQFDAKYGAGASDRVLGPQR